MKSIRIIWRKRCIIDESGRWTKSFKSSRRSWLRYNSNFWCERCVSSRTLSIFGDLVLEHSHFRIPRAEAQALVNRMLADENVLEIIVEDFEE